MRTFIYRVSLFALDTRKLRVKSDVQAEVHTVLVTPVIHALNFLIYYCVYTYTHVHTDLHLF